MKLHEMIKKPTDEHKKNHPRNSTLHYVVTDDKGEKVLGYIDDDYIERLKKKIKKDIKPEEAAKIRLKQVEFFKGKKK